MVEGVVRPHVVLDFQLLHVVNFRSGHLVSVLDGTLALFLIDDGLDQAVLDGRFFAGSGLVCVALVGVLLSGCRIVKPTYR